MTKAVVIDSDVIFALYNPNDLLNGKATQTFQRLIALGYQLVYPTSVIFEVLSLFQRVFPTPTVTAKLVALIKNDQLSIHSVDTAILKEAAALFNPTNWLQASKRSGIADIGE